MPFAQGAEILRTFRGLTQPAGKFKAKSEVIDLLHWLDFLPKGSEMPLPHELENQIALLDLAARFSRVFQLPLPHAPEAFFFGGEISHGDFGLEAFSNQIIGVGGAGLNFQQAFSSCIGEAAEYLSFVDYGDGKLTQKSGHSEPGISNTLAAWISGGLGNADWEPAVQTKWVHLQQLGGGKHKLSLPAELCLRQPCPSDIAPRLCESTGCAAGVTHEQATFSGLMEVIERDAIALWWYGGNQAAMANECVYFSDTFWQTAKHIRKKSDRKYWLLDITSDLKIPVIACLSSKPDGRVVIAGFAAHVDYQIAAEKAFIEMCQMELAQELAILKQQQSGNRHLNAQDLIWLARHRQLSTSRYSQFEPQHEAIPETCNHPAGYLQAGLVQLKAAGMAAYVLDLTRHQIAIEAVRVVVPHLQSADPTWLTARLKNAALENNIDLEKPRSEAAPV